MTGCVKVVLIAECGTVPETVWKISGLWHNCYVQIYSNIKCDLCMYVLLVISWLVAGFGV